MHQQTPCAYGDKEQITDLLFSEKSLSGLYNTDLSEAATPDVIATFRRLLDDSHSTSRMLFDEMHARGWYPVAKAEDTKVDGVKTKFGNKVNA